MAFAIERLKRYGVVGIAANDSRLANAKPGTEARGDQLGGRMTPELKAAIVWGALACSAKKRFNRELLSPSSQRLTIAIEAKIGRLKFSDSVDGSLVLGEPQTKAVNEKPPVESIIALLLDELPSDEARTIAMTRIKNRWQSYVAFPDLSGDDVKRVKAWLGSMTVTTKKQVSGDLVFV